MTPVRQLRRGRLRFDVHDDGPASGPGAVLLHGFPQDGTSWNRVLPLLHDSGVRTVVPDQRGYSPGARPTRRSAYRLELLVADVVALLDAAGLERAHLVGHDWGGGVAWAVAATAPQRVASLTVVSTPHPRAMLRALTRSPQALQSSYMAFFQLPLLPELVLRRGLAAVLRRSALPESDARHYAARMRRPGAMTAALNWYRAMPLSRAAVGDVTVPTTFVWGNRDVTLGRYAAELTEQHVQAPYRFSEVRAGHWLPETQPELLAEAVTERVRDGA